MLFLGLMELAGHCHRNEARKINSSTQCWWCISETGQRPGNSTQIQRTHKSIRNFKIQCANTNGPNEPCDLFLFSYKNHKIVFNYVLKDLPPRRDLACYFYTFNSILVIDKESKTRLQIFIFYRIEAFMQINSTMSLTNL